jgi:RNA polymerase sigma factor (sigma-70 family)
MCHPVNEEQDELRAEFTKFLETMVIRAVLNYLKKMRRRVDTVSIHELPEDVLAVEFDDQLHTEIPEDAFAFEEKKLATAFRKLPLMRQQVLTLLFVAGLEPSEIAVRLNCSIEHVYNQRWLAIKKLRRLLEEGGDER